MRNMIGIPSIMILIATVCACAGMGSSKRTHPYLHPNTETLLKNAAETIDFNIGYNSQYDITYMYRVSNSDKISVAQEREFAKVLNSTTRENLIKLFDAALKMQFAVKHKVEFFEKRRDWKNYTYCKSYLLPSMEEFSAQLKKALIAKDPSFAEIEKQLVPNATLWVRWYYRYAEEPVDTF